mgnify:CR=1 FL=1
MIEVPVVRVRSFKKVLRWTIFCTLRRHLVPPNMNLSIWWFEMFCESLCCCLWEANESVALYGRQPTVFWFGNTAFGQPGSLEEGLAGRTVVNKTLFSGFALRDAIWSRTVKYNVRSSETVVQTVVLSLANRFHKFWCSKLVENERRLTQSTPNTQMLSPQRPNRQNVEPISEGT